MDRKKIAIACQGGGSQTAFTAGVLKAFFEQNVHQTHRIVSLTGTSGGAVCAALAWFGLLKAARGDNTPIHERLMAFWHELSAHLLPESTLDQMLSQWMRIVARGMLPRFEDSPASLASQWSMTWLRSILPRAEFVDFKLMLAKHIDFDELPSLIDGASPVLLVGAADVMTGDLKIFNSRQGEICVDAILASAAVPALFPAVQIGNHYYWDGLFSDNPPLKELIRPAIVGGENFPDEIWVIQINATTCKTVPTSPEEIIDRRNQMIGNISLLQSLEFIEIINLLLREEAISPRVLDRLGVARREPVAVHFIHMSEDLLDQLDYVSKLSREPSHLQRLIEDGEAQARNFLQHHAS